MVQESWKDTIRQYRECLPLFLYKCAKSEGSIFRLNLHPLRSFVVVVTSDMSMIRQICGCESTIKPAWIYKMNQGLCDSEHILSAEGFRWKHARQAIAPAFAKKHVNRMNKIVLEEVYRWEKEVLCPAVVQNTPIDISKVMIKIILRGISRAAFDYKISDVEIEVRL